MTQTIPNFAAMSKADLVTLAQTQFALEQRRQRIFALDNKVMAAGEKLAWLEAQYFLASETPNDDELVCIPIGKIAEHIGMSEKTVGRYIKSMCERFESPRESMPYTTKAGQEINLTYIKRDDPLWCAPETVELDDEKLRTINGNECPCCHTNNLHIKKRTIISQEIHTCECCGYKKVTPVAPAKDAHGEDVKPFEPMVYWPEKKASQPDDLFSEHEKVSASSVATLSVDSELQSLPIWACHREKVPYVAELVRSPQKAKSNDPATWRSYEQTSAICEQSQREGWKYPYDGIGCFNTGDYVFIDLDHCIDEQGKLSDQARAIVAAINSYTEISQSKTGLHIICRGTIPQDVKRPGIEMYNHHRFFVWTGQHLAGTPDTIEARQAEIDARYKELVPAPEPAEIPNRSDCPYVETNHCSGSDAQIIEKLLRDPKARKLYSGDLSDVPRKADGITPDYSRADAALCEKLSYYGAGGDVSTIRRLALDSGLKRDKWLRDDYLERTINRAIAWQVSA